MQSRFFLLPIFPILIRIEQCRRGCFRAAACRERAGSPRTSGVVPGGSTGEYIDMKKIIGKIFLLLAVFLVCVAGFSHRVNRKTTVQKTDSQEATLPLAYMLIDGKAVNEMTGYTLELGENEERESLTPLPTDRTLTVELQNFDRQIQGLSYQVTSLSDGSLVENGQLRTQAQDGMLQGTFTLQNTIRLDQEYSLRFTADLGNGKNVYYYTRILQAGGIDLGNYLNFTENFYKSALNKQSSVDLVDYLESDDTASNSSFFDVNLHSSLAQVSWEDTEPQLVQQAVPTIVAVNSTTVSISLKYIICMDPNKDASGQSESSSDTAADASSSADEGGESVRSDSTSGTDSNVTYAADYGSSDSQMEYYTVQEYYRLRYSQDDMSLLDFRRSAEQVFNPALAGFTATTLNLGVQDRTLQYKSNQAGDITAFVANGELWSYNQSAGKAVRVFSFRSNIGVAAASRSATPDNRQENKNHEIKIEQVSENGDIIFLVYGYMAAGSHEGSMGLLVCRYQAETGTVSEEVFLPLAQSFTTLSRNISRLCYIDSSNQLYLFLNSEICRVSLEDGSYSIVQSGIEPECFMAAQSEGIVAWMDGSDPLQTDTITWMDLTTGKSRQLQAAEGEKLRALGFAGNDLAYGKEKDENILTDALGNVEAGMYEICIENMDGEVKKDFSRDGQYVTDVSWENGSLNMTLSTLGDDGYTEAGTDHIMNNSASENTVSVSTVTNARVGEQVTLVFPQADQTENLESGYAELLTAENGSETVLEWPPAEEKLYYVYTDGQLVSVTASSASAVALADSGNGFVLNSAQQYVYERGNWNTTAMLDVDRISSGLLSAPLDVQKFQEAVGDGYEVINLTGSEEDVLKYYLNKGYPVVAQGSGAVWLIVGYDTENFWIYDASADNKVKAIATDDTTKAFEDTGKKYLTCVSVP